MKNSTLYIFCLICFFSFYSTVKSQVVDFPAIQTKDTIIIEGKKYLIHHVEKGETLYSLSKTFHISQKELLKQNPSLYDGLKAGEMIKIPFEEKKKDIILSKDTKQYHIHQVNKGETVYSIAREYNTEIEKIYQANPGSRQSISVGQVLKIPVEKAKPDTTKIEFLYHNVEKKQTLYSISKKYKVSVEKILRHNPDLNQRSLLAGEVLKIPVIQQQDAIDIKDELEEKYIFHRIAKKETLYAISKLYDINISEILKHNPGLTARDLKVGEIIKIPKKQIAPVADTLPKDTLPLTDVFIDTTLFIEDIPEYDCRSFNYYETEKTFKVVLMLPFYLDINDTLDVADESGIVRKKIFPRSEFFLEFYEGALLAVEKTRQDTLSLDIFVFDTNSDSAKVSEILKNDELKNADLIIGPVYSHILEYVADFAKDHQINIVSPLSMKNEFLINNPYAFQVSPTSELQSKTIVDFLNQMNYRNFIVIHDGNVKEIELIRNFKEKYFKYIENLTEVDTIAFKEVPYFNKEDHGLDGALSEKSENIVIIPSDDQAFVSDVLATLNTFTEDHQITVFGMKDWIRFENIELDYLHKMKTHILSNSYIDYAEEDVIEFVSNYRKVFHTEPSKFSFFGYDVMFYFLNALKTYGKEFRFCIQDFKIDLLQTDYRFKRESPFDGFENNAIYIIKFNKNNRMVKLGPFYQTPE